MPLSTHLVVGICGLETEGARTPGVDWRSSIDIEEHCRGMRRQRIVWGHRMGAKLDTLASGGQLFDSHRKASDGFGKQMRRRIFDGHIACRSRYWKFWPQPRRIALSLLFSSKRRR
jgi:hypothetical protein